MNAGKIGFDSQLYLTLQSERILERVSKFGKLYLEFGGKLYDDYHAARVLPGFAPDNKLKMLEQLKDRAEIVIAISAEAIEQQKIRGDLGITYEADALRLKEVFEKRGFTVGSIVITKFAGQPAAVKFRRKLDGMGIRAFYLHNIEGYPSNLGLIVSDEGFGKNDYIETSRDLVVVTAPGPGSGKMATCLSQLYHENKRGVQAGYAKFETFPVWNLPLQHPVNLAYEAATADLDDVNMIDPYHLEAYGETTVNYNRDVEIFPVLKAIFESILGGDCPYRSPTDMGVNMVGMAISDDEVCREAARQEIIRRYFRTAAGVRRGNTPGTELYRQELLMKKAGCRPTDRNVVSKALLKAELTGMPAMAIELPGGTVVTGKTGDLLGPASGALLNALKAAADLPDEDLVEAGAIEPIQTLKTKYLGGHNPRLHSDEVLIALSASAASSERARRAMECLPALRGAQAHSTVLMSPVDEDIYRRLGIDLTCGPDIEARDYTAGEYSFA